MDPDEIYPRWALPSLRSGRAEFVVALDQPWADSWPGQIKGLLATGDDQAFGLDEVVIDSDTVAAWIGGFLLGSMPSLARFCGYYDYDYDKDEQEATLIEATYERKIRRFLTSGKLYLHYNVVAMTPSTPSFISEDGNEYWTLSGALLLSFDAARSGWKVRDEQPDLDGPYLPGTACGDDWHDFHEVDGFGPADVCVRCGFVQM